MACSTLRESISRLERGWWKISSFDVSLENAHGRTAHFRHQFAAFAADLDLDFTGAAHLDALRDAQRLPGAQAAMLHKIGTAGAAAGAGRRILHNSPGQHAARISSAG